MKKFLLILLIIGSYLTLNARKIGLALSGGGARSYAHIGVLKVIDELEIEIDYITGTSSGAFIGGLYAIGYSAEEIEEFFLNLDWENILRSEIPRKELFIGEKRWKPYSKYRLSLNKYYMPELPKGFLEANLLINKIFELTYPVAAKHDFDNFPIKYRCIATNILSGEKKVFSNGSLHEVIRASMSFPSILAPFNLDGQMYIDGGIVENLPTSELKKMGADFIIGVKTNSELKNRNNLNNFIDILDQTINMSIQKNISSSMKNCDIIIQPNLTKFSLLDFKDRKEIIKIGERIAREKFSNFQFSDKKKSNTLIDYKKKYSFKKIKVSGNEYLSSAKIREYLDLQTNSSYSKKEILSAFIKAYNFDLFSLIYPVIKSSKDNAYELIVKVKEQQRRDFGANINFNEDNQFIAGCTYTLDNTIQPNSKLLLNAKIGTTKEFNLDYVKNFGKHWGVYFRIFPNVREQKLFIYNDEHQKDSSVKSFEVNSTLGIGAFIKSFFVVESFGYYFNKKTYRDIGDFEGREISSYGYGLKIYHEQLDDYVFPMEGTQLISKFVITPEQFDLADNRKLYSRFKVLLPYFKKASFKYSFEYGYYYQNTELVDFNPFLIGGIDNFLGLKSNEKSAPIFKINTLALRIEPLNNLFIDLQANALKLGDIDSWDFSQHINWGYGLKISYKSFLGPLKLGLAFDEDGNDYQYFSLGYNFDSFEFSRY